MKKTLTFAITLLICAFLLAIVQAANPGYVIDNYEIDIEVTENNLLKIKETIHTDFYQNKHGIIRNIPTKNYVTRVDGTSEKNVAKVKNIEVLDEQYTVSKTSSKCSVKIGDPNITIIGKQVYVISYDYQLPGDEKNDFDELYFNLIGTEWDTSIKKVEFNIEMPKDFDESKLGFSSGAYGTIGTNDIDYVVTGNVISGTLNKTLLPGDAFTVRVELEEGYFVAPPIDLDEYMIYIVAILGVGISYLIWRKHGKDMIAVDTVEFYPPDEHNSAEIGYMYNGTASNKDVISLIVNLASRGYIKISDMDTTSGGLSRFSRSTYKLEKVKSYDGDNKIERAFMNLLFGIQPVVWSTSLEMQMENICRRMRAIIGTKENKEKIFEKGRWFGNLIIILCMLALGYGLYLKCGAEILMVIFIALFYLPFIIAVFTPKEKGVKIGMGIFVFFHMSCMLLPMLSTGAVKDNLTEFIFSVISMVAMIICLFNMPKRTPYGAHMLGRIKGFKNFIEIARKEEIESIVKENPTYVYDILPYAYVLGVSDKYMENFEPFMNGNPDWYYSDSTFSTTRFESFIKNMHRSNESSASPSSSSSGGSSGGGGGSSGGGSGGGGGSSW